MFDGGGKIKKGSQQLIKEANIRRIFKLVSNNKGISRAELANRTGLSPTTVSSLAEELIKEGMIVEAGTADLTTSGRKPIMLKVNPSGGCIVSADLRENGYNLAVFDLNCSLVNEHFIPLPDYRLLGKSLADEISAKTKKAGYKPEQLLGICIGAPGIIDREEGKIISSTILPSNIDNNFFSHLKKEYPSSQIELVNESSLSAFAETKLGGAGNIDNLIYIDIHTGIGAGIIINGSMYQGSGFLAGEFGHISVDLNGPLCKCGSRGCLETLASIPALIEDIEEDTGFRKEFPNAGSIDDRFILVAEEYRENRTFSRKIRRMARYIAFGINNAINLINPGVVVIGGRAAELGEGFLDEINEVIREIGLEGNKDTRIQLSEFKGNPVTAGGAVHIFNILF